jgi:hypothetical protein
MSRDGRRGSNTKTFGAEEAEVLSDDGKGKVVPVL